MKTEVSKAAKNANYNFLWKTPYKQKLSFARWHLTDLTKKKMGQ